MMPPVETAGALVKLAEGKLEKGESGEPEASATQKAPPMVNLTSMHECLAQFSADHTFAALATASLQSLLSRNTVNCDMQCIYNAL